MATNTNTNFGKKSPNPVIEAQNLNAKLAKRNLPTMNFTKFIWEVKRIGGIVGKRELSLM